MDIRIKEMVWKAMARERQEDEAERRALFTKKAVKRKPNTIEANILNKFSHFIGFFVEWNTFPERKRAEPCTYALPCLKRSRIEKGMKRESCLMLPNHHLHAIIVTTKKSYKSFVNNGVKFAGHSAMRRLYKLLCLLPLPTLPSPFIDAPFAITFTAKISTNS